MGRRRSLAAVALLALLAGLVALVPAGSAAPAPGVAWNQYLPALPSPSQTKPNRVAHCKRAKLKCVRFQIRRMKALQARLGCDHKAVFTTTYLELTKTLRNMLVADPRMLRWPQVLLSRRRAVRQRLLSLGAPLGAGERGPRGVADRVRDGRAGRGDGRAGHAAGDQRACAERHALRARPAWPARPQGRARKPDHDKTNEALAAGYERVVGQVGRATTPRSR